MTHCDDCGERVYGGYCTNCHEEVFIADQYERSGEPVPDLLLEKIAAFEPPPIKLDKERGDGR